MGYARALDLIGSGRVLSARETLALRLADFISPVGEALSTAVKVAQDFAANPREAMQAAKRLLRSGLTHAFHEALQHERAELPLLWEGEYRREAVKRFLNKNSNKGQEG